MEWKYAAVFFIFMIVGSVITALGIWLGRKTIGKPSSKYHCQSCGHGVGMHSTVEGSIQPCSEGSSGLGVLAGKCDCKIYIGIIPPERRTHLPPDEPEPTNSDVAAEPAETTSIVNFAGEQCTVVAINESPADSGADTVTQQGPLG